MKEKKLEIINKFNYDNIKISDFPDDITIGNFPDDIRIGELPDTHTLPNNIKGDNKFGKRSTRYSFRIIRQEIVLKPCPFCGGTDFGKGYTPNGSRYIVCYTCNCEGPLGTDLEDAVIRWNKRK